MISPASASAAAPSSTERSSPAPFGPRRLRVSFRAGAWHLHEEGTDMIGGIFTSLSAAVAFGRGEVRGDDGATVVIDDAPKP